MYQNGGTTDKLKQVDKINRIDGTLHSQSADKTRDQSETTYNVN